MLWDPFLYCINDSIQGNSETGNKVFVLPSEISINSQTKMLPLIFSTKEGRRKDITAKIEGVKILVSMESKSF